MQRIFFGSRKVATYLFWVAQSRIISFLSRTKSQKISSFAQSRTIPILSRNISPLPRPGFQLAKNNLFYATLQQIVTIFMQLLRNSGVINVNPMFFRLHDKAVFFINGGLLSIHRNITLLFRFLYTGSWLANSFCHVYWLACLFRIQDELYFRLHESRSEQEDVSGVHVFDGLRLSSHHHHILLLESVWLRQELCRSGRRRLPHPTPGIEKITQVFLVLHKLKCICFHYYSMFCTFRVSIIITPPPPPPGYLVTNCHPYKVYFNAAKHREFSYLVTNLSFLQKGGSRRKE